MKAIRIILLICAWISFSACEKKSGFHVADYQLIRIDELPDEVRIPSKVWSLADPSMKRNFIFSDVELFLVQKNPGVIEGEAVKILFPRGGGSLDLSRYVMEQRGSFFLGFDFPAFEGALEKKVFFVSNSRKRRIGSQVFGAGCGQLLDISKQFLKHMGEEGLKLNTTQARYLSVIGGTFIFAAIDDKEVKIAQVTLTSTQNTHLFCKQE